MLVRKNTKAFKTIQQLITTCQDRADRDKLIRLYITKAGDSINDRISIEGIQGDAALFYEMTYQTILNNLKSSNHQLQVSDEIPGLYFFHSSSNKVWDETPFEFDEAITKEFSSLPELPMVRKPEAPKKFVVPSQAKQKSSSAKREKTPTTRKMVVTKHADSAPPQPDFGLRHPIGFTNLDKLVFRQSKVTRRDVLEYYNQVADYLLPWLKDRPLSARLQSDAGGKPVDLTVDALFNDNYELPAWVKTLPGSNKRDRSGMLLCNDKEHLLLYVERGCLEFSASHSRARDLASPDYLVIALESPDSGLDKAIAVALKAYHVLTGLKLKPFIKTDGVSGFHIYIGLEAKSDYDTSQKIAEFICRLIRLTMPDLVTLKASEGYVFGKVSLNFAANAKGTGVIAPYSLVANQSAMVATPLLWEEVDQGLRAETFSFKSITDRLHDAGDPFERFSKTKTDADDLLSMLDDDYSFLL